MKSNNPRIQSLLDDYESCLLSYKLLGTPDQTYLAELAKNLEIAERDMVSPQQDSVYVPDLINNMDLTGLDSVFRKSFRHFQNIDISKPFQGLINLTQKWTLRRPDQLLDPYKDEKIRYFSDRVFGLGSSPDIGEPFELAYQFWKVNRPNIYQTLNINPPKVDPNNLLEALNKLVHDLEYYDKLEEMYNQNPSLFFDLSPDMSTNNLIWIDLFPELFLITTLTLLVGFLVISDYIYNYKYFLTNLTGKMLIIILSLTIMLIVNQHNFSLSLVDPLTNISVYTNFIKIATLTLIIICILVSFSYIKQEKIVKYEYYLVLGLSAIGMMCIISSNDLISMYMAIEIQSLSFYILATIKVYNNFSTEAGLKYFILGAFSSGILLFGCSFVYGSLGTVNFKDMGLLLLCDDPIQQHSLTLGSILILVAILFKLGAAPFHMWLPDVYEGVPTPVTAIYSIVPKIALFSLLMKLMTEAQIFNNQIVQEILIYVSVLSIIVGTLGGLYQTKIKRLLAYSAINHVGFLLIGLIGIKYFGFFALSFYIMVYIIISINIFTILLVLRRKNNNLKIKKINEFSLLFKSHPLLAINFCLILFSVAGIPPLAGFYSKFYIFSSAVNSQLYLVATISAIFSVIASMYYIRLIKLMFFKNIEYLDFFIDLTKTESYVISLTFFFNLLFIFYPEFFILTIYNIITKN